jgi:hypothetical protein
MGSHCPSYCFGSSPRPADDLELTHGDTPSLRDLGQCHSGMHAMLEALPFSTYRILLYCIFL